MHPVLFAFSLLGREITVTSYTGFLFLAAITAVGLGTAIAHKRGLDGRKSFVCLLIGLIASLIGARLVHWLTNPSSFDESARALSLGRNNLSAFAGMALGIPVAAICAQKLRVPLWRLADSATPAVALAISLARIGCLLNGCCFGQPTCAPWGIACPTGGNEHTAQILSGAIGIFDAPLPVHPTQIYEAIAALLGGVNAFWLLRNKRPDGTAFLAFALWFAAFRWINSYFLSTPASFAAPSWLYPAVYALVIVVCCGALARIERAHRSNSSM